MGNFMIGNFYPPFLGRIDKIYCGSEQCWPKDSSGPVRVYVYDNRVDRNIISEALLKPEDRLDCPKWIAGYNVRIEYDAATTTFSAIPYNGWTAATPITRKLFLEEGEYIFKDHTPIEFYRDPLNKTLNITVNTYKQEDGVKTLLKTESFTRAYNATNIDYGYYVDVSCEYSQDTGIMARLDFRNSEYSNYEILGGDVNPMCILDINNKWAYMPFDEAPSSYVFNIVWGIRPKTFGFKANITYINKFGQQFNHTETYLLDTKNKIVSGDSKFINAPNNWVLPSVEGLPPKFFISSDHIILPAYMDNVVAPIGSSRISGYDFCPDFSVADTSGKERVTIHWTVREGSTEPLRTKLYRTNEFKPEEILLTSPVYPMDLHMEGTFSLWDDFLYGTIGEYKVTKVGDVYRVLFYGYNVVSKKNDIFLGERRCTVEADPHNQMWLDESEIIHYLYEAVTPEPEPEYPKVVVYTQRPVEAYKIVDTYEIDAEALWYSLPMGHTIQNNMHSYNGQPVLDGDFTRYVDDFGREFISAQFYTYDYTQTPIARNPSYMCQIGNEDGTPHWGANHTMFAQVE